MAKYKEVGTVISQTSLAGDIFSMWIEAGEIAHEAKPGQFIMLYCRDKSALMPRPISICEINDAERSIRIVYRVVGTGTEEFSQYQAGDAVDIMGPLGNGFPLKTYVRPMIIGGGIGIPPLLELAKQLPGKKEIVLGFRDDVFMNEELEQYGIISIATEDGSRGVKGTVFDAINESQLRADAIFACGPTPMLRAVKQYAAKQGIEAWISLEEKMACGIGACLACVCQSTEKDSHTNVNNKRICKEGPVFSAREVEL